MGNVCIEKVQKLLHLDVPYPQFQTYEENLEFVVDNVMVKAVATVRWRWISIDIIEPFKIRASTIEPPYFCLGVMMLLRQEALQKRGMTDRDDFIERAKNAYIRHVTYLRLKPLIDAAQEDFLSVFREELQSLEATDTAVKARVVQEKGDLRKKFKSDQIGQKEYQAELRRLTRQVLDAHYPFSGFNREVEMVLADIKQSMVSKALE